MNTKELGARIRELRERRKLTLAEVARASGLAADSVGRIEKGRFNPSFETLTRIADGLGLPTGALFSDSYDEADDLANLIRGLPEPHKGVALALLGTLHVHAAVSTELKK